MRRASKGGGKTLLLLYNDEVSNYLIMLHLNLTGKDEVRVKLLTSSYFWNFIFFKKEGKKDKKVRAMDKDMYIVSLMMCIHCTVQYSLVFKFIFKI